MSTGCCSNLRAPGEGTGPTRSMSKSDPIHSKKSVDFRHGEILWHPIALFINMSFPDGAGVENWAVTWKAVLFGELPQMNSLKSLCCHDYFA